MGGPQVAAVFMYMLKDTPYSYFWIHPAHATVAEVAAMY